MPAPVIRNVSPLGTLHVPALDQDVEAGAKVVVEDVAVAASLLAQPDVWAPANAAAEALLAPDPDPDAEPAAGDTTTPEEG